MTVKYTVNNRVSPATVELLIRERSKGKSLRQLGQMFGRSHERVRKPLGQWLEEAIEENIEKEEKKEVNGIEAERQAFVNKIYRDRWATS